MNKSLRYIAILAILPLFTAGLTTDYFTDADATKGQGQMPMLPKAKALEPPNMVLKLMSVDYSYVLIFQVVKPHGWNSKKRQPL
jgi:hypothetical protein